MKIKESDPLGKYETFIFIPGIRLRTWSRGLVEE